MIMRLRRGLPRREQGSAAVSGIWDNFSSCNTLKQSIGNRCMLAHRYFLHVCPPSMPPPPSASGGWVPPRHLVFHPRFHLFPWNSRRRIQVSGRCRKGGGPPTRFYELSPRPQKIFRRHRPLPTSLGTLGVATPQGARVRVPPFHVLFSGITRSS